MKPSVAIVPLKQLDRPGNRKLLKNYKSWEFAPIKLSSNHQDAEILFSLPPDPLHTNLLGAGNDACDKLEHYFPDEMINFYAENHLKKSGQGPGGKFNGPSIKHILKDEILDQLENILPVSASAFITHLIEIWKPTELLFEVKQFVKVKLWMFFIG